VAPLGLLIENAGGYSSNGEKSVLDIPIGGIDDRTQVSLRLLIPPQNVIRQTGLNLKVLVITRVDKIKSHNFGVGSP
jgi:hypothetical protein